MQLTFELFIFFLIFGIRLNKFTSKTSAEFIVAIIVRKCIWYWAIWRTQTQRFTFFLLLLMQHTGTELHTGTDAQIIGKLAWLQSAIAHHTLQPSQFPKSARNEFQMKWKSIWKGKIETISVILSDLETICVFSSHYQEDERENVDCKSVNFSSNNANMHL